VVVLGYPGVQALDLVGPSEVFTGATIYLAGHGRVDEGYSVTVVSRGGEPATTLTGLALVAQPLPDPREPIDTLVRALPSFFADGHEPRASLIHGDLWSGNWGMLADGTPVIYDPAVSCADAEAELAMMELFGEAPARFLEAYRHGAGLHGGYAQRRSLYQLYHLLNHALLFGSGYVAQSLVVAKRLAQE